MSKTVAEKPIRAADFIEMEVEEGYIYELINGEIVKRGAPNTQHQVVSGKLYRIFSDFIEKRKLGEILYAPVDVFFDEYNTPQPDLLFVSKKRKEIITQEGIQGAPDLIIEILSPSTMKHDRGDKMKLYKKYQVREYWIVDPKNQSIEVYHHQNDDYELTSFAVEKGEITSSVLKGFMLEVKQVF